MRRRLFCLGAALMLLSTAGAAQEGLRSASLPARTPMQPIPQPRLDQFVATPFTYTPRTPEKDRRGKHHRFPFFGAPIGFGYVPDIYGPADAGRAEEMVPTGFLDFELEPGIAEVYVDGFYMGTVNDFRRMIPGRAIEAGPHRVELRAPGYESATFNVRVFPNEATVYRTDLRPERPSEPAPRVAPARAKTFYVIPGCYAGDKPPRAALLAPGCDPSRVRRIPPATTVTAPTG